MRVTFVDNLLFEDAEGIRRYVLQPHLGLISLIAVVEAAGHEAALFDPKVAVARGELRLDESLYHDMARRILLTRPDAVGLASLGCNFICTVKVASYLKRWEPELPVMLGGPHATVLDRAILQNFPQFDVIARNEAERTILPLLEALPSRSFFGVPGVTFRRGGAVWQNEGEPLIADLDSLPLPAYHHYPVRELGLTSLRVDAGRGCPFQCTFCSTASFFGRKYRLKSAARLVGELDALHADYGVSDFSLTHDLFTVNRQKVREFCDAVEGRGYTWKCSARMDCVDEALLERMQAAGCRSIYYGIEAGTERMQKVSKKRLDLGLFDPILSATQRLGMSATVSFITGYPEEEREDQRGTLDLVGSCFWRDSSPLNVQLHLLTPEPGTELLREYSDRIAYDGHVSDFNFPSLEADDSSVIESHPGVFINHHFFPSALPRRRHIFVTTIYQALYSLGFPVLRYVLGRYGGSLHRLVDAMERWAEAAGRPPACDQNTVRDFFAGTLGARHHVTGLVQYMLGASELRRREMFDGAAEFETPGRAREPEPAPGARPRYRLSRRSVVVRGVPDCPRLLEHLLDAGGPKPPGALLRRRYNFLLHLPRGEKDVVHNFLLTDASAALLEYFDGPRSLAGGGGEVFESATGYPAPPAAFLDALAERGILEAGAGT